MEPTVLIATRDGKIVTSDKIIYFLTPCCNASATGTQYGTACRGCYHQIDPDYGMAATVDGATALDDVTMMVAWLYGASKITSKIKDDAANALEKAASVYRHPSRAGR